MAARQKLFDRLPMTGNILRGSLLTRTIRNHAKSCDAPAAKDISCRFSP